MEEELPSGQLVTVAYADILFKVGFSIGQWGFDKTKDTVWNFIVSLIREKHQFTMALDKLDNVYNKIEKELSVYSLLSIIKIFPDAGFKDITDPHKYAVAIMDSLNSGLKNASTIKPDFEGFIYKGDLHVVVADKILVSAIIATVLYAYAYTDINPASLALILYQKWQNKRIKFNCTYSPKSDTLGEVQKLMINKDAKVQNFCRRLCNEVYCMLSTVQEDS